MNLTPSKIKEFRLNRSLSLQQLADLAGLSKASIQQYEDATTRPSTKALMAIADALNVGLWEFFSTRELKLELAEFRHGEKLDDSETERLHIHERIIGYSQSYVELEQLLGMQVDFVNPIADMCVADYAGAEEAAVKLRKKWKLYHLPIDDICGTLEERGFKIVTIDRQTESPGICGFITEDGHNIPFIIININSEHTREITRKRFTLVHELAHLCIRFADSVDAELKEKLCNRFGSAFLLPAEVLRDFLGSGRISISLEELRELKEIYGLSVMSIIYRAAEINLVDQATCQRWIDLYNSWYMEGKKFGTFIKSGEEPVRLKRLISRALAENRITREKVHELFGVPLDRIDERFGVDNLNLL